MGEVVQQYGLMIFTISAILAGENTAIYNQEYLDFVCLLVTEWGLFEDFRLALSLRVG